MGARGPNRSLTPKQECFVREFLVDQNGAAAAVRAGYGTKDPASQAYQLLHEPLVKTEIDRLTDERRIKTGLTAEYVLGGLQEIANRCMQRVPVMRFDRKEQALVPVRDENGCAVWQFNPQGANKALELLGKHLNLWVERVEISGELQLSTLASKLALARKRSKDEDEDEAEE